MSEELSLDTRAEAEATPDKAVRRWQLEIKLAQKREKEWRERAKQILDRYRGKEKKKNSFNILWANTEVLRPALYNSTPKPDVRRRFRQNDILGKAVSELMERGVSYCVDAYDLDNCLKGDVLDALLPGRGLSRVRYVPKIRSVRDQGPASEPSEGRTPLSEVSGGSAFPLSSRDRGDADDSTEAYEGTREEVEYEQASCDHVQWDDFLHGPGKVWEEVQWVGFRCRLSRDDQIEKFGEEVAKQITLDDVDDSEIGSDKTDSALKGVFKRSTFWEIWDKEGGKVFFVNDSYKKGPIYPKGETGTPPLKLKNFFPCPRPLMLVEDTGTLIPIPLYDLYKEQAEELDQISARINKIVRACKVRAIYDSTLSEFSELMKAGDNDLVPTEQARAWMTNGGIEKAIWWMPVEQIAKVLKELYLARESAKAVIYEITGISDIIRGVTNPNETLGAQQLKANSSSLRLQRMQREVQRYVRDLIRLLAEVIGENFEPATLAQMTGLQFPTAVQKQQIQLQLQAMQQQMQPRQQPPPQLQAMQHALQMPTWEEVMGVLRSDMQREFRVDVETDSTVAQSLQQDMEGLREVITAIVEFWQGVGPAVEAGAVSIDAVKAITMTIARRARMGLEVEDALESGLQQPKPKDDGKAQIEQAKLQAQQQTDQARLAHDQQVASMQQQHEAQIAQREAMQEQQRMQMEAQAKERDLQAKYAADIADIKAKHSAAMQEASMQQDTELKKIALQVAGQIEVAKINAGVKAQADAANAQIESARVENEGKQTEQAANEGADARKIMDSLLETQGKLLETLSAPKELIREGGRSIVRIVK